MVCSLAIYGDDMVAMPRKMRRETTASQPEVYKGEAGAMARPLVT